MARRRITLKRDGSSPKIRGGGSGPASSLGLAMRLVKPEQLVFGFAALGGALGVFSLLRRGAAGELGERDDGWFRSVVQGSPDVVMVLGADCSMRYVSPSVRRILGYRPDEMVGTALSRYLRPEDAGWVLNRISGTVGSLRNPLAPVVFAMRHADASWRYLEVASADLRDDPEVGEMVCYVRDVTDRMELQNELQHRALHDPLTGLSNRALFMDRLCHALARAPRHRAKIAVFFVDLDGFKAVNDEWGHAAGDRVLVTTSRRLEACLRPADTAARLGGDEFSILLENISDVDTASYIAERVVDTLRAPIALEDRALTVSASVGIAMSGVNHNRGAEGLLHAADAAMYEVKARGGSDYALSEGGAHKGAVGARPSTGRGRRQRGGVG